MTDRPWIPLEHQGGAQTTKPGCSIGQNLDSQGVLGRGPDLT